MDYINKKLLERIPSYLAAGALDAPNANSLSEYLRCEDSVGKSAPFGLTRNPLEILYITGAALICFGAYMFVNDLWDSMSTALKYFACFAPLVLSALLGLFTLLLNKRGTLWGDFASGLIILTFACALGGVADICNFNSYSENFIFALIIAAFALTFIFNSPLAALVAAFIYGTNSYSLNSVWPCCMIMIMCCAIYLGVRYVKSNQNIFDLAAIFVLIFALPISIFRINTTIGQVAGSTLPILPLALYLYAGSKNKFLTNLPLLLSGYGGGILVLLYFSDSRARYGLHYPAFENNPYNWTILIFYIAIICVSLWLLKKNCKTRIGAQRADYFFALFALLPLSRFFIEDRSYIFYFTVYATMALLIISALIFITKGIRSKKFIWLNWGCAMLFFELMTRVSDKDIDTYIKALLFIVLGTFILALNLIVSKTKKNAEESL